MQFPPQLDSSRSWIATFFAAVALFFLKDGIVAVYNTYLNRKKPKKDLQLSDASIHESEARAAKTLAEARYQDVLANKTAAEVMLEMIQALRAAEKKIDELCDQREVDRKDCDDRLAVLKESNRVLEKEFKMFRDGTLPQGRDAILD